MNKNTEANKVDSKILAHLTNLNLKPNDDYVYNVVLSNKKKPDILIRDMNNKGDDNYSCIIENKLKYKDLTAAKNQALNYAEQLLQEEKLSQVFIIIVTDAITFSIIKYQVIEKRITYINELTNIDSLEDLTQDFFLNFYQTESKIKISKTGQRELKSIFDKINGILRNYGLSKDQRLHLTMSFLFLKLIENNPDIFGEKEQTDDLKDNLENLRNTVTETNIKNVFTSISLIFKNKFSFSIDDYKGMNILTTLWGTIKELDLDSYDLDIKGEAFEDFINYGSIKSDIGEYFTPRHIVNFMISLLDKEIEGRWLTNKTGDLNTFIDPTCGTGGFLISIFKKLLSEIEDEPDFIETIKSKSVFGVELSKRTSEIAKMNMILAGDGHTNIENKDFLSFSSKEKYRVAIGNMPFGKEIKEPKFVDGCLDLVDKKGYALFIIPSGVVGTTSNKEYIKVRERLLNKGKLLKLISLPQGVFAPYTFAKTYIILWKNEKPAKSDNIEFVEINNDGFSLTNQREVISKNDILSYLNNRELLIDNKQLFNVKLNAIYDVDRFNELLLEIHYNEKSLKEKEAKVKAIKEQLKVIESTHQAGIKKERVKILSVEMKKLKSESKQLQKERGSFDFSLKFSKHSPIRITNINNNESFMSIEDVTIEVRRGPFGSHIKKSLCVDENKGTHRIYEQGHVIKDNFFNARYYITKEMFESNLSKFEVNENDILMSCAGTLGRVALVPKKVKAGIFNSVLMRFRVNEKIIMPEYFLLALRSEGVQKMLDQDCIGVGIKNMVPTKEVLAIKIPVPSIQEQKKVVLKHKQVQKRIAKAQGALDALIQQQQNIVMASK